jgi:hypothetical protein
MRAWRVLAWPAGLVLVVLGPHAEDVVPWPAYIPLVLAYVVGVGVLLRERGRVGRASVALTAAGPGLFALVTMSGPPTADEPALMMLNTAILLVAAVVLCVAATHVAVRHRHHVTTATVLALGAMWVGTAAYVLNLLARVAVVLSGASGQQAAVEDTAWIAFEYLRGLDGEPTTMAYLLVWFDLIQLAYIAVAYACFAAIAALLHRAGSLSTAAAERIRWLGITAAALIVGGVTMAYGLPRSADLVPAWTAFVLAVPFMTTLLPYALGLTMRSERGRAGDQPAAVLARDARLTTVTEEEKHHV